MIRLKLIFFLLFTLALSSDYSYSLGNACCQANLIIVSGTGKASGIADVGVLNFGFDQKGKTSEQALNSLSQKVSTANVILKNNGLGFGSIETGSLNVYPEYNFKDGRNQVVGQRATQTLTVRVRNLDPKGAKVGKLVDQLSLVDGIKIDSISFDIWNKTKLQDESRAAAFKDAEEKAEDYAQVAGLQLGQVITIDDSQTVESPPLEYAKQHNRVASADLVSTNVPIGQLDVNYRTTVTFRYYE